MTLADPQQRGRDGTSQAARSPPALDPASVGIDERRPQEWLDFIRRLARRLRFVDADLPLRELDWSGLVGDDVDLDRVVAFMDDPGAVSASEAARFGRPHFALLLAFLRLIGAVQGHMGALTRRHLDYFFTGVLRLGPRPPRPDQVHLVLAPAPGVDAVLVPAGAEFDGGSESGGAPRIYRSDREVIVHRAEVAELRTIFVDQRITGIREARERRDPGTDANERFVRMFAYALGEPAPGDPLPPYRGEPINLARLADLRALVGFAGASLHLELFAVRALVQRRRRRDQADDEWAAINAALEQVGRRRSGDGGWALAPSEPRRFAANLDKALGVAVDAGFFAGLPEVQSVDDLYDQHLLESAAWAGQGPESDVSRFIRERLFFAEVAEFAAMMAIKRRGDADWAEIVRLLERAGQRRRGDRSYRLAPADPSAFTDNFAAALGDDFTWPPGIADIAAYEAAIATLEAYFFMPAETFAHVMAAAPDVEHAATARQWERIDAMLAAAHRAKVFAGRRAALAAIRGEAGWHRALEVALDQAPSASDESPLPRLTAFVDRATDRQFLTELDARLLAVGGDESKIADDTWARAIQIVELAQRVRQGAPPPVARRVEWRNLYAHSDATALAAGVSLADDRAPRWHTFGAKPTSAKITAPPPASFGWAIASPILGLSEGSRTIVLTLGLNDAGVRVDAIAAALGREALIVEVSTAEGWARPTTLEITQGDYAALTQIERALPRPLPAIQLTLTFAVEVAGLAAMSSAASGIPSDAPALRVMMRPIWDPQEAEFITLFAPFRALELAAVHLRTAVAGLAAIAAANDHGEVDARRPFEPFTHAPAVGSRWLVGHPELAKNHIDSLTLHLQWMRAPVDLGAHYVHYGLDAPSNRAFTATVAAIDHRRRFVLAAAAPLFADADASAAHAITIPAVPAALARIAGFAAGRELCEWRRFLEIELRPLDFQHSRQAAVASQQAIAYAAAVARGEIVDADDYRVNPPYTPTLRSLTIDYTSSLEIVVDAAEVAGEDAIFHVRPFGAHPIAREEGALAARLFPAFDHGGELLIGLRGAAAPEDLTLLFQLAEGSADPDLEPVAVTWSYLSGDRWLSLHDGGVLSDGTRGLLNSGIVALRLPAAAPSSQLPPALTWLRVAIPRAVESVCDVVAIHAQALTATFVDRGDAIDHYAQPLAAATIHDLVVREPKIGAVDQPYSSFGGAAGEADGAFRLRVSERLRHKRRALTIWDYERLVLERFPEIYKVKCIPAASSDDPEAIGQVDLLVIPDIRFKPPLDPFEPKIAADRAADIAAFLAPRTPAFARVRVRSARYVEVKVRFGVRFREGAEVGFYRKRLSDELCRFLSPWAYEEGADIVIGGRIYANSIIDFIDRRDYVDHLATIKLFRSRDGRDFEMVPEPIDGEGYFVATERPDEILVAAREHVIDVIAAAHYESNVFTGIDHMKVELDFVVG